MCCVDIIHLLYISYLVLHIQEDAALCASWVITESSVVHLSSSSPLSKCRICLGFSTVSIVVCVLLEGFLMNQYSF